MITAVEKSAANKDDLYSYVRCPTCELPYMGPAREKLVFALARHTAGLDANDPKRLFAQLQMLIWQILDHKLEQVLDSAEALCKKFKEVLHTSHPLTLECMRATAIVLGEMKKHDDAERLLLEAKTAALDASTNEQMLTESTLAGEYVKSGQHAKALSVANNVLAMRKENSGGKTGTWDILLDERVVARALLGLGKTVEACTMLESIVVQTRLLCGDRHSLSMETVLELAGGYLKDRRYGEAEVLLLGEENLQGDIQTTDDVLVLDAKARLASALAHQRKYDDAEIIMRALVIKFEQTHGAQDEMTITHIANLARMLHDSGKMGEAEKFCRLAVDYQVCEFEKSKEQGNLAYTLIKAGECAPPSPSLQQRMRSARQPVTACSRNAGKHEEATGLLRVVLRVQLEYLKPTDNPVHTTTSNLAYCLAQEVCS